jgi:hypothetical protein
MEINKKDSKNTVLARNDGQAANPAHHLSSATYTGDRVKVSRSGFLAVTVRRWVTG